MINEVRLPLPAFAWIIGTRVALGVGIGLLVSERLALARRRAIGAGLVALGAATTIPAAALIFGRRRSSRIGRDQQLIGATRFPRKGDDGDLVP
jgi:hypothetical protein